jgi:hypothetical protein
MITERHFVSRIIFGHWLIASLCLLAPASTLADETRDASGKPSSSAPCMECIQIRVGLPRVVRGPSPGIPDCSFSEVQLSDGTFRGFSASGTTYAIDGANPVDMGGQAVPVLRPGPRGSFDASTASIHQIERSGNGLLGWVHCETGDAAQQGLWSIALAQSDDNGMTWTKLGQIIASNDVVTPGKVTGEGNPSVINGEDGYYYAYVRRTHPAGLIVARAPIEAPGPGHWMKYFNGTWSEPGLGGNATKLNNKAGGLARWMTPGQTVGVAFVPGGLGLFFSQDQINFTPLAEPLLVADPGSWRRPNSGELCSYWSILDAGNGSNQIANKWLLIYMYVQPNEGMNKRYLVFRPVDVRIMPHPISPQVGVMLARWYNNHTHDYWTTTAPVPGNHQTYYESARLGYVMTAADRTKPCVELEEFEKAQLGPHPDRLLTLTGSRESQGYQRLRSVGWIYANQEQDTHPLYQCYSESEHSHFLSNSPDGEGKGKVERLLGYALAR